MGFALIYPSSFAPRAIRSMKTERSPGSSSKRVDPMSHLSIHRGIQSYDFPLFIIFLSFGIREGGVFFDPSDAPRTPGMDSCLVPLADLGHSLLGVELDAGDFYLVFKPAGKIIEVCHAG